MEYSLDFFTYWKYHVLVLYYWLAEFPPVVRICSIFIIVNFLLMIVFLVSDLVAAEKASSVQHRIERYRNRFYDGMREIALAKTNYSIAEITDMLRLSSRIRVKTRKWKCFVPLFRTLFVEVKGQGLNRENWRNMLYAFKMPTYFEMQVRSPKMKERLDALKDVSDISCDLKEATASRYLYSKNDELRLTSRLHAARYGMSYPFRVWAEDSKAEFTQEMCTKLHWVLKTRRDLGLSIPNLIRWCGLSGSSVSFRLFAVNEIRLFGLKNECPELLNILTSCKDETLSIAIIRTLGELQYEPAQPEFFRRYMYATIPERQAIIVALGAIDSGSTEVVEFLVDDYYKATSAVGKVTLLKVLYDYGEIGKEAFMKLKAKVPEYDLIYFDHVQCNLIDSRKYA